MNSSMLVPAARLRAGVQLRLGRVRLISIIEPLQDLSLAKRDA